MVTWDVRLQVRYGFYAVYAVLTAVYAVGLRALPPGTVETALPLLLVTDPAVLGFYFVGALVLIEKREGVLLALVASPLGVRGYLLSKTLSLSGLAVAAATALALLVHPGPAHLPVLLLGLALTGAFFVLVGLVAVSRFDSINAYFLSAITYGALMYAPLLSTLGIYDTPAFYLLPLRPALLLVDGAFSGVSLPELTYAVGYLGIGCTLAFAVAERSFERHVVQGSGDGRQSPARPPGRFSRWIDDQAGAVGGLVLADLRNWVRDPILLLAATGPVALALSARFGLPIANRTYLPGIDLVEHYPLALGFVALFPAYIYGVLVGFFVLEDREQGTIAALRTTPLTGRGYLAYRGATAYLLAAVLTLATIPLFGLVRVPTVVLLPVALVVSLGAPAIAFLFASLARDAIEGVAINKLLGLVILAPVAGVALLPEPIEYATGVVPLYWPMKALLLGVADGAAGGGVGVAFVASLAAGVVSLGAAMFLAVRRFERLAT